MRIDAVNSTDQPGTGSASCDLNSDGLLDLVIGDWRANGVDNLRTDCGEVSVLLGKRRRWLGASTIDAVRDIRVIGQDPFDQIGLRLDCGDINGDGTSDLILGSYSADGRTNSLSSAGQVHLVFGSPNLPAVIDLQTNPGTVIYGTSASERAGEDSTFGDVNGDGINDVLVDAKGAPKPGFAFTVGAVYVHLGRANWPATLDAASNANVTIYGRSGETDFPSEIVVADFNQDGTGDLAAAARTGDTPVSGRQDAGDVFMFRGRSSWPSSIDLQTQSADCRVYGADAFDYIGHVDQLAAGDIDNDSSLDLVIGVRAGDGRNNNELNKGELRLITPGTTWPTTWDLRTSTKQIVYGQRAGDQLGTMMSIADVNGDGSQDLISAMMQNDHVDGSRTDAGSVVVVLGRNPFPIDTDLALGQEDWRIIGANANDFSAFRGVSDINDDGILEIVVANTDTTQNIVRSVWIVSPLDVDGDGHTQLADVCPLVSDPFQFDSDGDGRGNACALDWDGDGVLDASDCKANDARAGTPPEIGGISLTGSSTTLIQWQAATTADRYEVYRGLTSSLASGNYGTCQNARDPNPTDTEFAESQSPSPGQSFQFLVRAVDAGCGGVGTLGTRSNGVSRTVSGSCP